jgi:hypothetical protein
MAAMTFRACKATAISTGRIQMERVANHPVVLLSTEVQNKEN